MDPKIIANNTEPFEPTYPEGTVAGLIKCRHVSQKQLVGVMLVEKKRTAKWLAGELGKNPSTVSKWWTYVSQPDLYTLDKIATLPDIDKRELITGKD